MPCRAGRRNRQPANCLVGDALCTVLLIERFAGQCALFVVLAIGVIASRQRVAALADWLGAALFGAVMAATVVGAIAAIVCWRGALPESAGGCHDTRSCRGRCC